MEFPNLNYINELAGDDIEFKNKFIQILKNEFPIEKTSYLNYIENNNTHEASQIVHKLKHKMNILGLTKSYKTAVAYEEALRIGETNLNSDFIKIMKTIEDYLNTI